MASRLLTATVPNPGFLKRILFLNAELALAMRQPELASKYADKLQSLVDSKYYLPILFFAKILKFHNSVWNAQFFITEILVRSDLVP